MITVEPIRDAKKIVAINDGSGCLWPVWMGKAVDGVVASFGVDAVKCLKTFWEREVKGETLSHQYLRIFDVCGCRL